MNNFKVTVEIRDRRNQPMTYSTSDKKDAQRFAAYYRNRYKYPSVKVENLEKISLENIDPDTY